jgi:histidine triad (HIT) family protein
MRWHDSPGHFGHVLVVPNEHYENIYDLPAPVAAKIHECARVVALATKSAYRCDGVTLRQNNEPQGGQDVWHCHLHIYPRSEGDSFPRVDKVLVPAESCVEHAGQLRPHMVNHA